MTLEDLITTLSTTFVLEPEAVVTGDTELLMSGLLDSLSVVNLIAWIETEFGATIDPVDVIFENFETPETIFALTSRSVPSSD